MRNKVTASYYHMRKGIIGVTAGITALVLAGCCCKKKVEYFEPRGFHFENALILDTRVQEDVRFLYNTMMQGRDIPQEGDLVVQKRFSTPHLKYIIEACTKPYIRITTIDPQTGANIVFGDGVHNAFNGNIDEAWAKTDEVAQLGLAAMQPDYLRRVRDVINMLTGGIKVTTLTYRK